MWSASEKENLRTERKQNYVIKNEKRKKTLTILLLEQQKNDGSSLFFSSIKLASLLFVRIKVFFKTFSEQIKNLSA